ncbi:MAG: DNA adenine methylase [Firmicutes bacterium]|nr:DNA adenine methylase [Bacillota bacterium]
MPLTCTPLRYPGGKSKLYDFMVKLLKHNRLNGCTYVEPFAGGAGLALSLLQKGHVNEIIINDLDYSIYAFWYCVLYETEKFVHAITEMPINIDEWEKQRDIQRRQNEYGIFEVGLSTFFLNRVNRSGIIKGGVIGGLCQEGQYRLDCRFNKTNLIEKIKRISTMKDRIKLYNLDVVEFIPSIINDLSNHSLIYFDPPYFAQGSNLYYNYYTIEDHKALSILIKKIRQPWILTYDNEPLVYEFYRGYRISELRLTYSAGSKRSGTELVVYGTKISPLDSSK